MSTARSGSRRRRPAPMRKARLRPHRQHRVRRGLAAEPHRHPGLHGGEARAGRTDQAALAGLRAARHHLQRGRARLRALEPVRRERQWQSYGAEGQKRLIEAHAHAPPRHGRGHRERGAVPRERSGELDHRADFVGRRRKVVNSAPARRAVCDTRSRRVAARRSPAARSSSASRSPATRAGSSHCGEWPVPA